MNRSTNNARGAGHLGPFGFILGASLLFALVFPLGALVLSSGSEEIRAGMAHPLFLPALLLTLRTTLLSLVLVVVTGIPLAWWLATSPSRFVRVVEPLVELPIVIPPAVVGIALLHAFGLRGLLGPALESAGIVLPFSENAVVLAQVVVSAPFFVQAAKSAFRKIDFDLFIVARTLGASPTDAFARIAVPMALPGIFAGASLSLARSLGEFGATLLFAGNFPGTTQTMPLAIFAALESDVRLAVVFSLVLAALAVVLLLLLRSAPLLGRRRTRKRARRGKATA